MNKVTLIIIWILTVLTAGIAIVSLSHTRSHDEPVSIFEIVMYGWMFLPTLLLGVTAYRVFRKRMLRPWSSSMLIASVVYALFYSAMFIQIAFFPGSSTDAIGLLIAPVVASGTAVFAGWIVHLVFEFRHQQK